MVWNLPAAHAPQPRHARPAQGHLCARRRALSRKQREQRGVHASRGAREGKGARRFFPDGHEAHNAHNAHNGHEAHNAQPKRARLVRGRLRRQRL